MKYPIGKQDFKAIREEGYLYVDKTRFIAELLEGSSYSFLARPRRFGKSLFLSTLECFFRGERDLFKGLYIDSYDWEWEEFPVIHIDLNGVNYTTDKSALLLKLNKELEAVENKYEVKHYQGLTSLRLDTLIRNLFEKTGRKIVVLVDEYEKPILDTIDNPVLCDQFREELRGFYGVLKSLDRYLKFVFITGITKFGKMNIFSQFNNILDISLLDRYNSVCGITDDEIREYFKEGVEKLGESKGIEPEGALSLLKENYDGYHFSENCPDLYNPYSLICALANSDINPYWSETGTPTILAQMLLSNDYSLEDLNGIRVQKNRLMDVGYEFDDPVPLFYQTGYLTIKHYNRALNLFTLGFPNSEVEVAFFNFLMPYYMKAKSAKSKSFVTDFIEGIHTGDAEGAMKALEAFSSSINYDIVQAPEVERHFQNMIYLFSRLIMPYTVTVKAEEHTSDGRIDLLITTERYVYIFEFKRDRSAKEALRQIEERGYWRQFSSDSREVFLIGVNFSTAKRRIDGYIVKLMGN